MERSLLSTLCVDAFLPNATRSARGAAERGCCRGVRFVSCRAWRKGRTEPQDSMGLVACRQAAGVLPRAGVPLVDLVLPDEWGPVTLPSKAIASCGLVVFDLRFSAWCNMRVAAATVG